MTKLPTRSPTHEDVPLGRLSSMGLELEDIADGDEVALPALIELAEDRGRPTSHYLAAVALATELRRRADRGDHRARVRRARASAGARSTSSITWPSARRRRGSRSRR